MAFDPDEYLATSQSVTFDPDAYLAESQKPKIQSIQATPGSQMDTADTIDRSLVGFAAPMVKTYYGAKELIAGLSPDERSNLQSWQQMEEQAPIAATIAGNIAPLALGGAGMVRAGLTGAKALIAPSTAKQAAAVGGGYMALQPVGEDRASGIPERAFQGVLGAGLGAIGQKIASAAGTYLANKFGSRGVATTPEQIDEAINSTLRDSGQSIADLPSDYAQQLRNQVSASLEQGKNLDVKAAMRAREFESAGIKPTLGQITRDPIQYATEQNLRGVAGVGEPISALMTEQENALRANIGKFATGAGERYQAGAQIGGALEAADTAMSKQVSSLYQQARQSAGKDLELPLQGLAQDYATVLRDFGDKIPSGVRNNFEDLGLITGKQNKLFTVEEADRLLKVINANQSNDPAVNAALAQLRNAVKTTVTETDASGGAFAPAVKAAAQRFKMHDMLPALKDAAHGDLDADKFVLRHIVAARPESVQSMAKVLNSVDKEAYRQAKAQIGEYLRRAAYGINTAEDAAFRPAGFAKGLDSLGERLKAFYTPQEIAELKQLSRVGSFMNAPPAKSAVSTSNSGVPVQNALMGILGSKIPFAQAGANIIRGAVQRGAQRSNVEKAVQANVPNTLAELLPGELERFQTPARALLAPAGYTAPYLAQ